MFSVTLLVFSAGLALAEVTPTAPGPGDAFAAGSDCTIKWDADTSGQWTNVSISLMSGSNNNMTRVTTVASGLDGTDSNLTPYNWTCPDVNPYSAIYFYQFTNGDDKESSAWTTRFTITSPRGDSETPEHDTQPNGDSIPWGDGNLAPSNDVSVQAAGSTRSSKDSDQEDEDDSDDMSTATRTHGSNVTDRKSSATDSSSCSPRQ
ncbi:Ser-Thr-rich glycosyl-phosphatidyl-inositol-anchored membrane family-domain-containing protein [Trametes elegans]|nr:Ser-Thr-rich glycosyl-phosphatidyl-inositol-anchored membrane family-domain-containing protein [Trametes elegans]